MIDLSALFEFCMFITSYNDQDYRPYEQFYRTDYDNNLQDSNMARFSIENNSSTESKINDSKTDEFWLNRF